MKHLNIMVSKHSVFYSPLIAVIAGDFLKEHGYEANYSIVPENKKVATFLLSGEVDVAQAAVSANWSFMEHNQEINVVHFAEINQRDGFFILSKEMPGIKSWRDLEGCSLIAELGGQPFDMLRFALNKEGVDINKINWIEAVTLDSSIELFKQGNADFIHLQGPYPQQLSLDGYGEIVFSVGAAIGPVAFSSMCCTKEFINTDSYLIFLDSFNKAKKWVLTEDLDLVAEKINLFFDDISLNVIQNTLQTYRNLGCWSLETNISRETYEASLDVFSFNKTISRRHDYSEVVSTD
jgi:NitT/TauT family transport system substrate-binding protein